MRRASLALPLLLLAAPAAAQSPVPNHPVENAYQREELIRQQAEFFHRQTFWQERDEAAAWRAANSTEPASLRDRRAAAYGRSGIGRARMSNALYRAASLDLPLIAVTSRGVAPAHLDPASSAPVIVGRRTPLRLSVVSPDAGTKEPMQLDVSLVSIEGAQLAEFHGGLTTDENAVVRVDLPALPAGEYLLRVTTTSLGTGTVTSHSAEQRLIAPVQ